MKETDRETRGALLLSRTEVARLLGVAVSTVDRSAIPRTRLTQDGHPMFRRSDVMAFLESRTEGEPVPSSAPLPDARPDGSIYGPSERLAEGLMFGSVVTEVFYHDGRVTKIVRQRCETQLEQPAGGRG